MKRVLLFAALALGLSTPARAEWLEASSSHFVIYADDSELDLRRFATELERYHSAMALLTADKSPAPSPSNRVTVYVVRSGSEVRALHGKGSKYVNGFYRPRAGGSLAVVPRIRLKAGDLDFSMITLLHEYAHHFMMSNSGYPMPRWYSEGYAEFFSSARFDRDGSVSIGRPANHRAAELFHIDNVKVDELLDPDLYEKSKRSSYDSFYGKSWLLVHFLTFDEAREGQLGRYNELMMGGKSSREAALEAFGDLGQLEKDLDRYLARRRMKVFTLGPDLIPASPVAIRRLRKGEAAAMPVRIRSKIGVDEEMAQELLPDARKVAASYPDDPAVLAVLAEAEHDAGNFQAAIAAADKALAIDPGTLDAYVQKGYALFRIAADAPDAEAGEQAIAEGRKVFLALNRLENDHPIPLVFFYRSYLETGRTPTENAANGLKWAAELAPFDLGLKLAVARQYLNEGDTKSARRMLVPVAYNPHGGTAAAFAQAAIERIDNGEKVIQFAPPSDD
jgi:tetratricopeptide (TPR) repeat protein